MPLPAEGAVMLAPSSDLLRAELQSKLNRIKLATRSYLRDRTRQATGTLTSYAVAAALFAFSAVFLIAAFFVGLAALFRWVEIHYGQFPAFGVIGGLLIAVSAVLAGVAALRIKRSPPQFPSFGSRLRVALAGPISPNIAQPKTVAAPTGSPRAPPEPAPVRHTRPRRRRIDRNVQIGLAAAAVLLGWAAARRRRVR
jgi:hypothetical protein